MPARRGPESQKGPEWLSGTEVREAVKEKPERLIWTCPQKPTCVPSNTSLIKLSPLALVSYR
jgi:hypothetical protein